MTMWTRDELSTIGSADEVRIAPLRKNGSMPKSVTIWIVRVGDDLYVRSAYGRDSSWFRGAQEHHKGTIHVGSLTKAEQRGRRRVSHQVPQSRRDLRQHDGESNGGFGDHQNSPELT